ncbi:Arc family DNA-binding protein [Ruminococcus sp.]|uniref:Arc family DNA-binding protein n=1 Tax=Ruminococcus sp. TaxID=41978 RepID=UPI002600B1BE|nr:Arc family DNA-binding protein [Ruminococcus sp.]MBR1431641.1 Arc family DNA-binding protein [Ruminococcus sp.]
MTWTKDKATKYKNEFINKAYDRVNLTMPKGMKEKVKEYAEAQGLSLNGYINKLIEQDMKQGK